MKFSKRALIALVTVSLLALSGCYSDNSLNVWNNAPGEVILHFNGKRHELSPGDKLELEGKDVPAGVFTYGTVYTSGVAADVSMGEGVSGEIDFSQRDVHATLEYLVTIVPATDSTSLDQHTLTGVLITSANSSVPEGPDSGGGGDK